MEEISASESAASKLKVLPLTGTMYHDDTIREHGQRKMTGSYRFNVIQILCAFASHHRSNHEPTSSCPVSGSRGWYVECAGDRNRHGRGARLPAANWLLLLSIGCHSNNIITAIPISNTNHRYYLQPLSFVVPFCWPFVSSSFVVVVVVVRVFFACYSHFCVAFEWTLFLML